MADGDGMVGMGQKWQYRLQMILGCLEDENLQILFLKKYILMFTARIEPYLNILTAFGVKEVWVIIQDPTMVTTDVSLFFCINHLIIGYHRVTKFWPIPIWYYVIYVILDIYFGLAIPSHTVPIWWRFRGVCGQRRLLLLHPWLFVVASEHKNRVPSIPMGMNSVHRIFPSVPVQI